MMPAPRDTGRLPAIERRRPRLVPFPEDTTRGGDWLATSDLWERMGGRQSQGGPPPDPAVMRAVGIFGTSACLHPTWIGVARRESSMGTHVPWFDYKWARMSRQLQGGRRYQDAWIVRRRREHRRADWIEKYGVKA